MTTLRWTSIAVVCLALAGCLEDERAITLEPDGRGTFRLTRTLGAELSKGLVEMGIEAEGAMAEDFAASTLADFEGVAAWSDVVAAITTDKRIRVEATGWFEDLSAVHERNDTSGKKRPLLVVSREGDRLRLGLPDMTSGEQPAASEGQPIAKLVEGLRKVLSELRLATTVGVPGEASGVTGWQVSGRTLSHTIDAARLLPLLEGLPEGAAGYAELERRFEQVGRAEATVTVKADAGSRDFAERLRAAVEAWKTSKWRATVEEKRAEAAENAQANRALLEEPPVRTARPPDAFEPNDAREQAKPLAPGKHEGLVAEKDGEDWFALTVPPHHELRVAVQAPATDSVSVTLLGEDGKRLGGGMVFLGKAEPLRLVAAETERKGLLQVYLGEHAPYTVTLELVPWKAADAFEPNDSEAAAAPIAPGKHDDLVSDGEDWYRIDPADAAPGRMLEVELRFLEGPRGRDDLTLMALGPKAWDNLATTSANKRKTPAQVRVIVPEGGARLHVTGDPDVRYGLTITVKEPLTDALEPNDAPEQARDLGLGKHEAVLEGPDWYRVSCNEGKQLRLKLNRIAEEGAPKSDAFTQLSLQVYSPGDTDEEEDRDFVGMLGNGADLVVARRGKGPRLVRVMGEGVMRYSLEVLEEDWKAEDAFEPNDAASDAAPLGPGKHEVPCGKHDWYLVELPADHRLRFTLGSRLENMLQLMVYDLKDGDMLADAITGGEESDQGKELVSVERTIDASSTPRKLRVHIQRVMGQRSADKYTLEVHVEKR